MTTKGLKIGRPRQLPCPCCGMPVLTRPALSILVAVYCARIYGGQDLTLHDIERVTGVPKRSSKRAINEFHHLFWNSGKVGLEKTWALTGDGFDAVHRILDEKKEGAGRRMQLAENGTPDFVVLGPGVVARSVREAVEGVRG